MEICIHCMKRMRDVGTHWFCINCKSVRPHLTESQKFAKRKQILKKINRGRLNRDRY